MTYSQWCNIACRDGALTVYHFGETLKHVRSAMKDAKSIADMVDPNSLRLVTKKFESSFPDAEALRHAIAHASDLWRNVFHYLKNAITGKVTSGTISISGTNVALQYALNQRRFCAIREGRLACYEMSEQTLNSLITLKEEFYSAFRPAEQKLMELERASDKT